MSYCPKCGNEIREEMAFCPKCGAPLKAEQVPTAPSRPVTYRTEKGEKEEKREKQEKGERSEKAEKYEKREHAFIGPLIGGLVLLFIGCALFLEMMGYVTREILGALFFIIIGIAIIFGAVYGAMLASRRHPKP
jgi:uncharacterized membrane protein YvbJ